MNNPQIREYEQMIECKDIYNTIIFTNNKESQRVQELQTEKTKVNKGKFKVAQPDFKKCDKRSLTIETKMRTVFQDWDLIDEVKY